MTRSSILPAVIIFFFLSLCFNSSKASQAFFINGDGKFSASSVGSYLQKSLDNQQSFPNVITVLDCSSSIGESTVMNDLFGTSFPPFSNGKIFF